MDAQAIKSFQRAVLDWYSQHGRSLPWRQTTDPYNILVSEIMLQQTQVDRVLIKYSDWQEKFPTAAKLADAPTADVIRAWAGLGYNRRAIYLQEAAKNWKGAVFTVEGLRKLPGVGPYTAAAILSFASNADVALVDTNIKRIYQLLVFGDAVEPTDKQVEAVAETFLPHGQSRDWHNALMDIGTIISKERGARAQQAKLKELFPILKNLPIVSDQPLKRPKQTDFKSSRRFWRGRIIDFLREHHATDSDQLINEFAGSPYDIKKILEQLVKDKLIRVDNNIIQLP